MLDVDLTEGWAVHDDGVDVLITGPGQLEISLLHFDVAQLSYDEPTEPELLGTLKQLIWRYPLIQPPTPDSELQLIITIDAGDDEPVPLHMLHIGTRISWALPPTAGWSLSGYFSGDPVAYEQ
jgi:hypothetical protein